MLTRKLFATGCLTITLGLSPIPIASAAARSEHIITHVTVLAGAAQGSKRVSTHLTVLAQAKPACQGKICTIKNHGSGTMNGFGKITFTTVITDDTSKGPCPNGSYVPQLSRTITTTKGSLVLSEAGLVCPEPKVGPRVDLVWVADGARSSGIFAGVHGTGIDHAYLSRNTAFQTGTITLAG